MSILLNNRDVFSVVSYYVRMFSFFFQIRRNSFVSLRSQSKAGGLYNVI